MCYIVYARKDHKYRVCVCASSIGYGPRVRGGFVASDQLLDYPLLKGDLLPVVLLRHGRLGIDIGLQVEFILGIT